MGFDFKIKIENAPVKAHHINLYYLLVNSGLVHYRCYREKSHLAPVRCYFVQG
jgi:hypothetical protein